VRAGEISKRWKLVLLLVVVVVGRVAATTSGYSQSMLDHCILASQTHSTGTYGNNMSVNIKLELLKIQVVAMLHLLYGPPAEAAPVPVDSLGQSKGMAGRACLT